MLSLANDDLADDDPVAYTFVSTLTLTEDQVNEIEFEINETGDSETGVRSWLKNNRDVVARPWIDVPQNANAWESS